MLGAVGPRAVIGALNITEIRKRKCGEAAIRNYPLQMTGRSVPPPLAMGNAIVIKPAEDTSFTTLAMAKLAEEAGFPPDVFNVVSAKKWAQRFRLTSVLGISASPYRARSAAWSKSAAGNIIPVTLELENRPKSSSRTHFWKMRVPRSSPASWATQNSSSGRSKVRCRCTLGQTLSPSGGNTPVASAVYEIKV